MTGDRVLGSRTFFEISSGLGWEFGNGFSTSPRRVLIFWAELSTFPCRKVQSATGDTQPPCSTRRQGSVAHPKELARLIRQFHPNPVTR